MGNNCSQKLDQKYNVIYDDTYHVSPLPDRYEFQVNKDECSKISASLRKLINPYREDIEPHIYRLMESAITFSSSEDTSFKKQYYTPYLKSMTYMNQVKKEGHKLEKKGKKGRKPSSKGNGSIIWAEGDFLYYSQGKGRAEYLLF